ncbi:hypothetical protein GGG16DRAFT_113335 [Schizophyllum commune]
MMGISEETGYLFVGDLSGAYPTQQGNEVDWGTLLCSPNSFSWVSETTPKSFADADAPWATGSWGPQGTPRNASAVTACAPTLSTVPGIPYQPLAYAQDCSTTCTSCPDSSPSCWLPYTPPLCGGLDAACTDAGSSSVALVNGTLEANLRREVGSQAQTEASLKRRSLTQSRATYPCNYCQRTFTRKKNLQDHFLRHENRRGNQEQALPPLKTTPRTKTQNYAEKLMLMTWVLASVRRDKDGTTLGNALRVGMHTLRAARSKESTPFSSSACVRTLAP